MKIHLCRFLQENIRTHEIKLILIFLLIIIGYLLFNADTFTNPKILPARIKLNAFIITADCNSLRYNVTKDNIERVFPNFFNISCYLFIPLNDSRIHVVPLAILKKSSSNLLTFIDLWTYQIPKQSKDNQFQWTFIFEDDVNFHNATRVSLPNYIETLQELMDNPEVQYKHGFIYLGICGPTYPNNSQPLISKNTNNSLISEKRCGFCLHASGITTQRAQFIWTEISSYRPDSQGSLDKLMQNYCVRSKNYFYTFGTNFYFPSHMEHYGIAYQDHVRFPSTIT